MAEFKKLSEVEIVESPADNANVLIEEEGVIKKVAKSAVGGGAGGGGGLCRINLTYDYITDTFSADKTFDEIRAEYESGMIPVAYTVDYYGWYWLNEARFWEDGGELHFDKIYVSDDGYNGTHLKISSYGPITFNFLKLEKA